MRAGSLVLQDHVVLPSAVDLVDSKLGLPPMDSVVAFRVAGALQVGAIRPRSRQAAVVHTEDVGVLQHGDIADEASLPGLVKRNGVSFEMGTMQLKRGALQSVDEVAVDEELTAGADVDGLLSCGGAGQGAPVRSQRQEESDQGPDFSGRQVHSALPLWLVVWKVFTQAGRAADLSAGSRGNRGCPGPGHRPAGGCCRENH